MVELEPFTAVVCLLACAVLFLETLGNALSDISGTPYKSAGLAFVTLGWFLVTVEVGSAFFKAVFP